METSIVERVIELVGTQAKLARALGVSPAAIHKMRRTGVVPAKRCKQIELLTGGRVTAEQLRPDIFAPNRAA